MALSPTIIHRHPIACATSDAGYQMGDDVMNRTKYLAVAGLVAVSLVGTPAFANGGGGAPDQGDNHSKYSHVIGDKLGWVLDGLESGGYKVKSIKSSTLGRVRILAENDEHRREIVCNRATGVIRSDRIVALINVEVDGGVNAAKRNGGHQNGGGSHAGDGSRGGLLDLDIGAGVGVRVGNLSILGGRHSEDDDCDCGPSNGGGHGDHENGGSSHGKDGLGDVVDKVTNSLGL
jgi:hypothetical protein